MSTHPEDTIRKALERAERNLTLTRLNFDAGPALAALESLVAERDAALAEVDTLRYTVAEYAGYGQKITAERAALVAECDRLREAAPLDIEAVLWVAALDRVPIEERIEWVTTLKRRVEQINEQRAASLPVVGEEPQ